MSEDVAPTSPDDPRGIGPAAGTLPLVPVGRGGGAVLCLRGLTRRGTGAVVFAALPSQGRSGFAGWARRARRQTGQAEYAVLSLEPRARAGTVGRIPLRVSEGRHIAYGHGHYSGAPQRVCAGHSPVSYNPWQ